MRPSEAVHIADGLPSDFGVIREQYLGSDPERFVLLFQDEPSNWSVRWAIGKTLHHFQWVTVVGQDGYCGPIDTGLCYAIPDGKIKQNVALFFLQKLCIHAAEYANILRGKTEIRLIGVEDKALNEEANQLMRNQASYLEHQLKRAHAIARNLLKEMEKEGATFSALTCTGDLPDLVSDVLEKRGVSYVIVRPRMSHPSDPQMYRERMAGKLPSYEEILGEAVSTEPPPENSQDKKMEEMKERARANMVHLIRSEEILAKLKPLLPSANYAGIASIVRSTSYGPKTKAVLVKAELFRLLEQEANKHRASILWDRLLRMIGSVALIAALAGSLFGIGVRSWYLNAVSGLFAVTAMGTLLTRRYADACRRLLLLAGYVGGFYGFGRWGMLLGIAAAGLVSSFVIPKPKDPTSKLLEVQKVLVGKG